MVYPLLSIIICILKLELCYIYCYRKKEKKEQIGKMKKRAKIFARIHITICDFHNQKIYMFNN